MPATSDLRFIKILLKGLFMPLKSIESELKNYLDKL